MVSSLRAFLLTAALASISVGAHADMQIDSAIHAQVIETYATKMTANYVSPEVASRVAADLRLRLKRGDYAAVTSAEAFASMLTKQLIEQTKDEHVEVLFMPAPLAADNPPGFVPNPRKADPKGSIDRFSRGILAAHKENYGFGKSERFANNIAYVKIDGFYDPTISASAVASEMSEIADASALILDLRGNGGGSSDTGVLVSSYLFDAAPVHLTDRYTRSTNRTEPVWTRPVASDLRFGSAKPVYVLIDKETFSAAEDLAYALQALKRVTVVGERSKGGANGARGFKLAEHFLGSIPNRTTINPITRTNWQGTGITPDVAVPAGDALAVAQGLAAKAIGQVAKQ